MSSNSNQNSRDNNSDIIKRGYLKKLKSMKRKYFVLRGGPGDSSACLEYYLNEKKFKAGCPPRKLINLKACWNINQVKDTKQKNVIGLYSLKECFCIVLENVKDLEEWLTCLLRLQHGENLPPGEPVKPFFEFVWKVTVMEKNLGGKMGILGPYHLCLTDQTLTLVKASDSEPMVTFELQLHKIRACGHLTTFFYLDVGNDTVTGAGQLWMTTEDDVIAQTVHNTIMKACQKRENQRRELLPQVRVRTSSTHESSRPPSLIQRWPTHTGEVSPGARTPLRQAASERRHSVAAGGAAGGVVSHQRTYSLPLSPHCKPQSPVPPAAPNSLTSVRERVDCVGHRPRTTSEGGTHLPHRVQPRPNSMYGKTHSPPVHPNLLSPVSVTYSTDSADSSASIDCEGDWEDATSRFPHSSTPDEPVIIEENPDDYQHWPEDEKLNNYMPMDRHGTVINTNSSFRKISPNPFTTSIKSSSPSPGSFGEVYSPSGSSPLDTGYLPMSPGDGKLTFNHTNHSRGSSIAEEGYVTMAPAPSDDGYVDMDQKSRGSSCSLTSGTPSGGMSKLSEYSLDKVTSYISRDDEVRPARAYSFGSKPTKHVDRNEFNHGGEERRVRAFSLGNNRVWGRVNSIINNAPLSSSHSSTEPGDDLMELDFTKKAKQKANQRKKPSSVERLTDGGLSPPKGRLASFFGRSPPKPPCSPPQPSPSLDRVPETEPGYLEMKPTSPDQGYMEMKPVVAAPKNHLKPQNFPKTTFSPPIKPPLLSGKEDYLDMTLKKRIEDNNNVDNRDGYVEMNLKKTDENYMNMTGSDRKNRKDRKRFTSQPIKIDTAQRKAVAPVSDSPASSPRTRKSSKDVQSPGSDGSPKCPVDFSHLGHPSLGNQPPRSPSEYATFQPDPEYATYALMQPGKSISAADTNSLVALNSSLGSLSMSNSESETLVGLSQPSEDEANSTGSKSLSRTSSAASFSEKEVQYAALDLQGRMDEESTFPHPLSYAKIDFAKSRKLRH